MEELENETIEPTAEEKEFAKHVVELGRAMERLSGNEDFRKVFLTGYVDDFARTSVANMKNLPREARVGAVEAQLARSYFTDYMDEVINDANIQIEVQREEEQARQYEQQERDELQNTVEES